MSVEFLNGHVGKRIKIFASESKFNVFSISFKTSRTLILCPAKLKGL